MSLAALAAPVVVSLLLGIAPRRLAATMHPWAAVRVLAVTAFVSALTTGFALAVLSLVLLTRAGELAELGHWAPSALRPIAPLPWVTGLPLALALVLLLVSAAVHTTRVGHQLWLAESLCRSLGPDDGGPVVVDDGEPHAFAVSGLRGRVVLSTAMVAALSSAEREGLVAHEISHLAHRHSLWIQLAEVAATANPLLRALPDAVRMAAERWADEDAAALVGDRRVVAEAIGHAALARSRSSPGRPSTTVRLAATGGDVPQRVQALLTQPRLPWSRTAALSLVLLTVTTVATSALTARSTELRFEQAQVSSR